MIRHATSTALITSFASLLIAGAIGCSAGEPPPVESPVRGPESSPQASSTGCVSYVDDTGLLCTTCDGDTAAPECLPAECDLTSDHCLQCTDPRGRVGTDCSIDYSTYEITVGGTGDADDFSSCGYLWGTPNFWSITCHFPGTTSCEVREGGLGPGWNCLRCEYPNRSAMSMCSMDQLPDPLDRRPLDLPAPGSCIDERSPDGLVVCTTCTRDDLGAVRSCRYAGVQGCGVDSWQDADSLCRSCQASDGSQVDLCTSRRPAGPEEAGR